MSVRGAGVAPKGRTKRPPSAALATLLRTWRRDFATSGLAVIGPPALPPRSFRALAGEARRARSTARRGGLGSIVPQFNARGRLGRAGKRFLSAAPTVRLLSSILGRAVEPAFEASCYTYYDRTGHFCGVHRDRPDACHFTILLCLHTSWRGPAPGPGLTLEVFGARYQPRMRPRTSLPSVENNIIVLRGSKLYHGRPHLRRGERATVLTACYRLRGTSRDARV